MILGQEVRRLILLLGDTRCWKCSLAPLAGSSPGLGRSGGLGGRRRLRSPVGGLGLGSPVVGNLESGGSSGRGSGSRSSRSAVSGPVGHRGGGASKLLTSPLFLGRRSNEVG